MIVINPLSSNYSIQNLLITNDFSPNLTLVQIVDRANTLSSLTQDIYKATPILNTTSVKIASIIINITLSGWN